MKLFATSRALYRSIKPDRVYLTLKTYLEVIIFLSLEESVLTSFYVPLAISAWNFSSTIILHSRLSSQVIASLYDHGSSFWLAKQAFSIGLFTYLIVQLIFIVQFSCSSTWASRFICWWWYPFFVLKFQTDCQMEGLWKLNAEHQNYEKWLSHYWYCQCWECIGYLPLIDEYLPELKKIHCFWKILDFGFGRLNFWPEMLFG